MIYFFFFAGPTSFAPIVEMATTIVEKSGGQYHVLLIIADGQVHLYQILQYHICSYYSLGVSLLGRSQIYYMVLRFMLLRVEPRIFITTKETMESGSYAIVL